MSSNSSSNGEEHNSGDQRGDEHESSNGNSINNGDERESSINNIINIDNGDATTSRVVEERDVIGEAIQKALANESSTELYINLSCNFYHREEIFFLQSDVQRIMDCLRVNPRFTSLRIEWCRGLQNPAVLKNPAVLNIICNGLLDCPSVTCVRLPGSDLTSEGLNLLQPALYNTSITSLGISNDGHNFQGQRGGEALRNLMVGNNSLVDLDLSGISFDRPFTTALGNCLHFLHRPFVIALGNNCFHFLQKLYLGGCGIGNNDAWASMLLPANGRNNTNLIQLYLGSNSIQGAKGGQQVGLLLQRCPNLKVLYLGCNKLGPLGACAMAPGLAASNLESLNLSECGLGSPEGGQQVGFLLQYCQKKLKVLNLTNNHLGPLGARALAPGLAASNLESLNLAGCSIGNDGVMDLVVNGQVYTSLTSLDLSGHDMQGLVGGQQVGLLLQHCPNLKVLDLSHNDLGSLGVHAMAPGLAAASNLESLNLSSCHIGNDGVTHLVPVGQVNMSLTHLNLEDNNIEGLVGGENVVALAARCTNLDRLVYVYSNVVLNPDQQRRLDLLLDLKHRLCIEAQALAGSTFPILFRFVKERAHGHEHGLSAIFVILQNDGDDYFCTANNRAIPS